MLCCHCAFYHVGSKYLFEAQRGFYSFKKSLQPFSESKYTIQKLNFYLTSPKKVTDNACFEIISLLLLLLFRNSYFNNKSMRVDRSPVFSLDSQ